MKEKTKGKHYTQITMETEGSYTHNHKTGNAYRRKLKEDEIEGRSKNNIKVVESSQSHRWLLSQP